MVLVIACATWVFDSYDSQIFNVTRNDMLAELLGDKMGNLAVKFWGDVFLGIYLIGGAVGGTLFGSLADRIGRRPTMIITIIIYTVFSGLTALVHAAWQVAVLRFIVAMGTAGAWAVGAAFVSEVFSARSRAQAGSIFHATSNMGTALASAVGLAVGANWRLGYVFGFLPILMVFWVRASVQESTGWKEQAQKVGRGRRGSLKELLLTKAWGSRAVLGMLLAAIGIGTYWCITVAGMDLVQDFQLKRGVSLATARAQSQFAYGFLINGGGFIGSIAFGPIAHWLGRRRAFFCAMLGGALIVPLTAFLPQTYGQLLVILPLYGFLTFGYHSGFAFYLPELFPAHLRSTGAGFCFNGGRVLAAVILGLSGWLKSRPGMDLHVALSILAVFYLLGLVVVWFLPETNAERFEGVS
jgi:MFS family permease